MKPPIKYKDKETCVSILNRSFRRPDLRNFLNYHVKKLGLAFWLTLVLLVP